MAKPKFRPPFSIVEPLDREHFLKGNEIPPLIDVTDKWTVEDADSVVISTHSTRESAERGLEAVKRLA